MATWAPHNAIHSFDFKVKSELRPPRSRVLEHLRARGEICKRKIKLQQQHGDKHLSVLDGWSLLWQASSKAKSFLEPAAESNTSTVLSPGPSSRRQREGAQRCFTSSYTYKPSSCLTVRRDQMVAIVSAGQVIVPLNLNKTSFKKPARPAKGQRLSCLPTKSSCTCTTHLNFLLWPPLWQH